MLEISGCIYLLVRVLVICFCQAILKKATAEASHNYTVALQKLEKNTVTENS